MRTNYQDPSCLELCRERPMLEQAVVEQEQILSEVPSMDVFEGEITCSGLCVAIPGERRCYAAIVQPFSMETSEVPVQL